MKKSFVKLNRFTTLPFLIELLKTKKMTLVNPVFWEDYNDRATMESYRRKSGFQSIYALCLTHQNETVHHWNSFAPGSSGCCIEFKPAELFEILDQHKEVRHDKVQYVKMADLSKFHDHTQMPFLKRHPFRPESEYRIIATSAGTQQATFDVEIDLRIIRRITLSNRLPKSIADEVEAVLRDITPEFVGKISRSTLYDNQTWINHFNSHG